MEAVDVHAKGRIIEILRHEHVGDQRRLAQLAGDILRDLVIAVEVRSNHLHVNRGWRAHADDGIYQASGGEEWCDLRHFFGDALLDLADVS